MDERTDFEKWYAAFDYQYGFAVSEKVSHKDAARAAWEKALTIGEARGRVMGMGDAAGIAESNILAPPTQWGKGAAYNAKKIADAIRQAASQGEDLVEDVHAMVNGEATCKAGLQVADALREMLALWERVHGAVILGRPTVNAAKKALADCVSAQPAEMGIIKLKGE